MQRYFTTEKLQSGCTVTLSKDESTHLSRVMRLKEGDSLELFDGNGVIAVGKVAASSPAKSVITVETVRRVETRSRLNVAFGLSKSSAVDFIIHRCTEVGVKSFTPVITQHSLHTDNWNEERWKKVIIEVSKQCQGAYLPSLHKPIRFADWIKSRNAQDMLLFSDEAERESREVFVPAEVGLDILIGPEGGWSSEERSMAKEASASVFALGENRLRAETAALVAVILAKQLVGEI